MKPFLKILLFMLTLLITVDGSSVTARKPLTQAAANDLVDNNQWLDYMRNNRLSNAELGRIGAAFVYKGHEQFMYSPQVDFAVTTLSSLTGITEGVIMLSSFAKKMILRLIAKKLSKGGRIIANSLKEYKALVQQISKPGSQLTKAELQQFQKLTEQFGGTLRYDLNPVKGKILQPHVQVEGLGSKVGSRHIWLGEGAY